MAIIGALCFANTSCLCLRFYSKVKMFIFMSLFNALSHDENLGVFKLREFAGERVDLVQMIWKGLKVCFQSQ